MRTRYCSVCAFLLEERFSVCSRTPRGYLARAQEATAKQKPFHPTIILFLSTFPLFSPRTRYCESPISFSLPLSLSFFLGAHAATMKKRRGLFPVVYSRVFFVSSASFLRFRRSRPWANLHANRGARTSITADSGEMDGMTSGNLVIPLRA